MWNEILFLSPSIPSPALKHLALEHLKDGRRGKTLHRTCCRGEHEGNTNAPHVLLTFYPSSLNLDAHETKSSIPAL